MLWKRSQRHSKWFSISRPPRMTYPLIGSEDTITCAACNVHRFQDVNVVARHLRVSYKETSCCQSRKSASYQICMLVIYTFRFLRAGKCFVVTVCIINTFAVFLVFTTLCIAVIRVYVCFCNLFLLTAFYLPGLLLLHLLRQVLPYLIRNVFSLT